MDRFWRHVRLAGATALALATGLLLEGAGAEEDYRIASEVVLRDVYVVPARTEGRAQITFVLENRSAEWVSFGGIAIAGAGQSRIVAALGNGATTTLGSVPIAPGEVLSADGEALWIEVDGLARDLSPGETIEATVSFGTAVVPINLTFDGARAPSN